MKKAVSISLLAVTSTMLIACGGSKTDFTTAQYWQRANASEAIYQRGPKAQQMIQRDISRCVSELRELERLGYIKDAFPAPDTNPDLRNEQIRLSQWETPERDGYLLNESATYYDFEECMEARGWERVAYLPYKTKIRAEENYVEAIKDAKRKTRTGTKEETDPESFGGEKSSKKAQKVKKGDFDELND